MLLITYTPITLPSVQSAVCNQDRWAGAVSLSLQNVECYGCYGHFKEPTWPTLTKQPIA